MKNPISLKIKRELNGLEKDLKKGVDNTDPQLKEAYLETLTAGGKRLRPAIVFLCSQFKNRNEANIKRAAFAVEAIHMASLLHDDIMDRATLRRGKPTIYSKFGKQVALRVGDYLFAKAFLLLNETGNLNAVTILARAVRKLSEGEIEQMKSAFNPNQSISYYYKKIGFKTASLFRISAELGAIFGNTNEKEIKILGDFAENLGMAFQIYDDILDVEAKEDILGKSLGTDLKDGTLTLPILFAIKESKNKRLSIIFANKKCSKEEVLEGLDIIALTKAVKRANKEARAFVDKALLCIEPIKNRKLKRELRDVCEYTIDRYN